MTKRRQKKIEKDYFEKFRSVYTLPEGRICHDNEPDFIICGQDKIGIEMTNFYIEDGGSSESEQRQKNLRKDAIQKAQKKYRAKGGKGLEFSFGFNTHNPISDKQILADELADIALTLDTSSTGEVLRCRFEHIKELSFMYVNSTIYSDPEWRIVQVYTGQGISRERLVQIVQNKNKKAENYEKCDSYWLIIIVDFVNRAQDVEIRIDGFEKIQSKIFTKIIVYRTVFNDVLEI